MTVFIHELLCVDGNGGVSVVHLTIEDADPILASQEVGPVYTLDGTVLAATPVVLVGDVDLTLTDGSLLNRIAFRFVQGGNTYFVLPDSMAADAVAGAGAFNSFGTVGGIAYTGYGFAENETPRPYQGQAFLRSAAGAGPVTDEGVNTITVYDDDKRIQTTVETGAQPQGHVTYHGNQGTFGNTAGDPAFGLGPTSVDLVEVAYTGGTGAGTFEALEFTFARFGTTYFAYLPRNGTVDLAEVDAITGVTALPGSVDGANYTEFGLNFDTTQTNGTSLADLMVGDWVHNRFTGLGGADTLAGGLGEDQLYGGAGADLLSGGQHADTLDGGAGGDRLFGRSFDDLVTGQDGADQAFGGYGNDTVEGGKGNDLVEGEAGNDLVTGGNGQDQLSGGLGRDTLDGGAGDDLVEGGSGDDQITDGSGADTLFGNAGADTFVFGNDGAADQISDFVDGVDLIDMVGSFASLTFVDIAPGEVHVTHAGEVLILLGFNGTLTSADLTRADFL